MDFKELNYIIAICDYSNITKAANATFVSQPALTKFLKSIENKIGEKLFVRVDNKYIPTQIGEVYVKKAREILSLSDELEKEIELIRNSKFDKLTIGLTPIKARYLIPITLPKIQSIFPSLEISIFEGSSHDVQNELELDRIDLAFLSGYKFASDYNLTTKTLKQEEIILIISNNNHLIRKMSAETIQSGIWKNINNLAAEKLIIQHSNQGTGKIMVDFFNDNNIKFNEPFTYCNFDAALELVARDYGITFIRREHLKYISLPQNCLTFSCGADKIYNDYIVAYKSSCKMPRHTLQFIDIMKEAVL